MPSTLSWLDTAPGDRRRALELLRLFQDKGTVDELGIGVVRDAISDVLFPGTSTLHTRARYFLLIPWVYQQLEKKGLSGVEVGPAARRLELRLISSILKSEDAAGAIGKFAGDTLKVLPSGMYWNGIRRWGILRFDGSREAFARSFDRRRRLRDALRDEHEADSLDERSVLQAWDPAMPAPPRFFPDPPVSLALTPEEAEYLQGQIQHHCPGTLLAHLVTECDPVEAVDFVWNHPDGADFPPGNAAQVAHARNFSELIQGAVSLYNLLVARRAESDGRADAPDLVAYHEEAYAGWCELVASSGARFRDWDRQKFWAMVHTTGLPPRTTVDFVERWWDAVASRDPATFPGDAAFAKAFTDREIRLKGLTLARLASKAARSRWGGESGGAVLNYRWAPEVRALTNDILIGLGR